MPNDATLQMVRGNGGELRVVVPGQRSARRFLLGLAVFLSAGLALVGRELSRNGVSALVAFFPSLGVLGLLGGLAWYLGRYELRYLLDPTRGVMSVTRRAFKTYSWELPLADITSIKVDSFKGGHWLVVLTREGRELRFGDGTGQAGYFAAADAMNELLLRAARRQSETAPDHH